MLKWVKRDKVEKESGHIAYIDLFYDVETMVEYLCYGDKNLIVRADKDGKPMLYHKYLKDYN